MFSELELIYTDAGGVAKKKQWLRCQKVTVLVFILSLPKINLKNTNMKEWKKKEPKTGAAELCCSSRVGHGMWWGHARYLPRENRNGTWENDKRLKCVNLTVNAWKLATLTFALRGRTCHLHTERSLNLRLLTDDCTDCILSTTAK